MPLHADGEAVILMLNGFNQTHRTAGRDNKALPKRGAGLMMQGIDNGALFSQRSVKRVLSSTKMLCVP